MNFIRRWLWRDTDRKGLMEMLDLSIKSGRRVTHDFHHCISMFESAEDQLEKLGVQRPGDGYSKMFRQRADMWHDIFYPLNGMKDYRAELYRDISNLKSEIRRLERLCEKHNIDHADPESIPF